MSASAHIFARRTLFRPRAAALGLALVLLAGACDNTVQPFAEDADALFTLSGFLSTAADTQFVRVEPVRRAAAPPPLAPLDAAVTTTRLETGATVAWRDSLVRLDDGTTGHLFYAVFRPEPGAAYRLDVRRPDGRGTSAVTRVPDVRDARIEPPAVDSLGNLKQTVFWPGAGFVTELTLRYEVIDRSTGDSAAVALPYAPYGERFGQGWRIIIHLERDYRLVLAGLELPQRDSLLILRGLDLTVAAEDHVAHVADILVGGPANGGPDDLLGGGRVGHGGDEETGGYGEDTKARHGPEPLSQDGLRHTREAPSRPGSSPRGHTARVKINSVISLGAASLSGGPQ